MNKLLAQIFLFVLMLVSGILVMIYGWGLEAKSWWWIVGGGIFARVMLAIISVLSDRAEE